ncbi:MAG: ubiquinone-binding protein [Legionellales bacterium]|nr:ubiquinone-binding protein [Legionellales bacterium]|tara:strand:+ start:1837 stop:2274 length:438 start_codon:yes stop_codon:yes gene_type:complete
MRQIKTVESVPYSASEMYALINDVESYPSYIPWCPKTQVVSTGPNEMVAKLYAQKGPVTQSFTTRNILVENQSVSMHLVEGPFKHLKGEWTLTPQSATSCVVDFEIEFEFANPIMDAMAGPVLEKMTGSLVEHFKNRAKTLHGAE